MPPQLQLLFQLEFMEQNHQKVAEEHHSMNAEYQAQIKELCESQDKEQTIQEQIWQAQMKELKEKLSQEVEKMRVLQLKQVSEYDQVIQMQAKRIKESETTFRKLKSENGTAGADEVDMRQRCGILEAQL